MLPEQNKAIVRGLIDICFNGRDLSRLAEFLHPEFVNHQEIFPLKSKKGSSVFEELYSTFFKIFSDVRADYHNLISEGDLVMAYDNIIGTNDGEIMGKPPTGKKADFQVFHLYRVEEGKLIERWGLTDDLTMLRQLGLITDS